MDEAVVIGEAYSSFAVVYVRVYGSKERRRESTCWCGSDVENEQPPALPLISQH